MSTGNEIAIIGLAGRFPGAEDADAFWRNLRDGVESVTFFGADELESSVLVPPAAREQAGFVPAGGVLADADRFDHELFGMSPREARWMDPQQRVFLELAWAALEDAGYDPGRYPGRISVYAGAGTTGHLLSVLAEAGSDPASLYEVLSGDNLATRASFALGLRGESITVHTACSTGLAVVHLAAQSLLLGQSGLALAGAVRISVPQQTGYVYADGMILSPDGHCRAFDHRAAGTVSGNGAGVVVLKPLADAVADGDRIYAVIEGSAMNNEGHRGVGYTAPSVAGQADVITEALSFAGVSSEQIGYVEAHGTGTPLGDPIEIAALTRAFRQTGSAADCLIGSVKTNIGHLDAAAGIAGLIKVALMLRHGEIPPSLHLEKPNPSIAFDDSPFDVNTAQRRWERNGMPRRAGISSFGIGGTNVHAVLTEAPEPAESSGSSRPHQLVTLSAHTGSALTTMATDLAGKLDDSAVLADVAYTRAVGRAPLRHRRSVVAADLAELKASLRKGARGSLVDGEPRVALLFPGQGSAWHGMAAELYKAEPAFREELDRCLVQLEPRLGRPLLPVLLEGSGPIDDAELAHAAIFAVEVALARLWLGWGVRPVALLGHSFGEYAAACVAGVYSLPDAAELALIRGRLVAGLPEGGMLAVGLTEDQLKPHLQRHRLSLAAVNGDGRCVVSGPADALAELRKELDASVPLPVRYAFHSAAVEPIMAELAAAAERFDRKAPRRPLVSCLTGDWWAESPDHWARQLREPVRFAAGLDTIAGPDEDPLVLIEVGADQALTSLARAHLRGRAVALPSLRRRSGEGSDHRVLLESAGAAWSAGVPIDWDAFYRPETRRRVELPTYPFEGSEHRLAPRTPAAVRSAVTAVPAEGGDYSSPRDEKAPPSGDGPRDEVERQVFAIWQDRLGRDDFGIHDNFLELGGNSLTAAQVLTRLRDAFGVPIPLSALFEAPTVAGAADRIRAIQGQSAPAAQLAPVVPVSRASDLPLSVVQARTLAMEAADPGNPQLVMPAAIELTGELDHAALQRAIQQVVRRHETLRTTFHGSPDWVQRIEPDVPVTLEPEDLTDARAQEVAREEPSRPFDLAVSPFRARLLRLAADRHVLLVTIHHVVCDTWSLANLMGEIAAGYRSFVSTGRPAELPALNVQYADFAAWQRTALDGGALAGQADAWRRQLAGTSPLAIPDLAAGSAGYRGHKLPVALDGGLSGQITEAGRRLGSTGFVTLLAAYSVVLGRLADSEDVLIGTPIGNRDRVELEPLIGYVAHAIGLRADLSGDPSFTDLVERLQRTLMTAYANPDVPYEAVVDEVDPGRSGGRMFDALIVVHSGLSSEQEVPGGRWSLWEVPGMPAMFGPTMSRLSLMLVDSPDGFAGAMEYADGVDPAAVTRIFEQITEVLADAVARPQARISTLARPVSTVVNTSKIPQLSLSYFANDEDSLQGPKYQLLLEGAKLADRLGFTAIWTPERHFHPFGGLYPSPTAINAGLATVTERLGLRAGSVVLPLHDPIRVAEEWSVIDNLSGGRAGVSFASGWNVNDFVLAPDAYADRRDMRAGIDAVRRLWRGESITRRNGIGEEVEIRIRPRPVQAELPFWVTAAGSPATFQLAGELGGFVLTNLMGQTLDALADKLEAYRKAWRAAGHGPGDGHVTLMLHAFVADDTATAYQQARQPLLDYFRSSVDIIRGMIAGQGLDLKPEDLSEDDLQTLLEHGLQRYLRDGGLFGTPADCLPMLERVRAIGVDEVAALIDFGVPTEETLHSVELLGSLLQPKEDKPLPLSFAQQRLWYLEQLTPQNIAYNNHVALRIRGRLDHGALQNALQQVVRRHDVLRTTFPSTDDGAVQVIAPDVVIDLPVEDATETEIADRAREHVWMPIDLATGPLLRAKLLRLADDEHVLLVTMHHIVSDGWSAGVLLTELGALYTGAGALLPELTWQYADYAVWQREVLASGALDGELDYWKTTLADVPMLDLPTDRPRGGVQGHAGARCPVRLDRSLTDALHALGRRAGVTPYMVLHAGLTALLHRYSGQTDLAIGTAVAGRNHPRTEPLVGCFVNSVVIRTDVSEDPAFGELLGRVKDSTLGALAHAELPFERLVDALLVPRSLSQSPLFQTMLVLHNTPSPRVELGELTLEPIPVDTGLSKLDLVLELREEPDGITGSFEYNTDLFDADTVEQLAGHLVELLSQATTDPDRRLSDLDLASGADLSAGAPLTPRPGEALFEHETVDAILAAQAALTPDAPAVGELTYGELRERANRIAHGLRAHDVGPGSLVGLLIDDPGLAITAMAGVIAAGGGYVPLDPKAPRARHETMAEQAGVTLLLTDGTAGELAGRPVLPVGEVGEGQPADPVPASAGPDDVAYVIFTSGSTGKPKGVVVEHRQLVYSTRARRDLVGPAGTCLSLQPMTFDPSTGWIWYALLTGGTIWRARPEVVAEPQALAALIAQRGITHLGGVPALYGALLAAAPERLGSLRIVLIGGESLPPELIRAHAEALPAAELHNFYGPAEATIFCTACRVDTHRTGRVPIGRPSPGGQSHVLDHRRRPVPAGAVGELYVGGPGVARGYVGSPELTAERFVEVDGKRLYRTGDRVRWNRQGLLEFFGRVDRQVKIRGMRVEPGEVEAVLAGHPGVTEAAVIPAGGRLIGYVALQDGTTAEGVRAFAEDRLPDYLVPAHLVVVGSLPRTAHGKVDVAALPEPPAETRTGGTAPRNARESALAEIFASVLGLPAVDVDDNFYELGGDSILAISVVTRARREGIELTVRQMVQSPTVAGLAAIAGTNLARPADQAAVTGPVPLTPVQRWFFDLDLSQPWHWNEAVQLKFTSSVREDLLQEAFRAVLQHHDALRLRFTRRGDRWSAQSAPAEVDWRLGRIEPDQADAFQADCDLASGPLLRAALIGSDRLLVVAHHLVTDGVSWRILLTDLFTAYGTLVAGGPIDLPQKTTSYAEWARRIAEVTPSAAELEHWKGLDTGRSARLPRETGERGVVRVELEPDRTQQVLRGGALDLLLTATASALANWAGGDHVLMDLGHHGREDLVEGLDVVRTVGWFSGFHPVLLPVPAGAGPAERLGAVREHLRSVPANGAGFIPALVAGLVDVPPAEVLFTYLGQLDAALPADAPARILDEIPGRLRSDGERHQLEITAGVLDGRLWLAFSTDGSHRRDSITALAEAVTGSIDRLV